jgi:alternate signal-mediated exported protein
MTKTNEKKNNKKRIIVLLGGLAALALVVGAWAFYTATHEISNQLSTTADQYGSELVEKFTPKVNWLPGEEVTKEVYVQNTGDSHLYVRVKMEETWTLADKAGVATIEIGSDDARFLPVSKETGKQLDPDNGLVSGDGSVVFKELDLTGWSPTPSSDGYWYYMSALADGASTSNLLKSITLATDTDMGLYETINYYTTADDKPGSEEEDFGEYPETQWVVYDKGTPQADATYMRSISKMHKPGYTDATYVLTITSDVFQATEDVLTESGWNIPANVKTAWKLDEE